MSEVISWSTPHLFGANGVSKRRSAGAKRMPGSGAFDIRCNPEHIANVRLSHALMLAGAPGSSGIVVLLP